MPPEWWLTKEKEERKPLHSGYSLAHYPCKYLGISCCCFLLKTPPPNAWKRTLLPLRRHGRVRHTATPLPKLRPPVPRLHVVVHDVARRPAPRPRALGPLQRQALLRRRRERLGDLDAQAVRLRRRRPGGRQVVVADAGAPPLDVLDAVLVLAAPLGARAQLDLVGLVRRVARQLLARAARAAAAVLVAAAAALAAAAEHAAAAAREQRLDGGRVDGEDGDEGLADGPHTRRADVADVVDGHDAADDGGHDDEDAGEEQQRDEQLAFDRDLRFPEDGRRDEGHEADVGAGGFVRLCVRLSFGWEGLTRR